MKEEHKYNAVSNYTPTLNISDRKFAAQTFLKSSMLACRICCVAIGTDPNICFNNCPVL